MFGVNLMHLFYLNSVVQNFPNLFLCHYQPQNSFPAIVFFSQFHLITYIFILSALYSKLD